jgi:pimeloyl-ACP methyl ester carboxylesterase
MGLTCAIAMRMAAEDTVPAGLRRHRHRGPLLRCAAMPTPSRNADANPSAPSSGSGGPQRAAEIIGPSSCYYISQRLRLHYVDWGNPDAPPVLLVHGGRDHARSWDHVALALRDRFHVVAPDLRGHGDSAWAIGSNYTMVEFVYDLAQLVDVVTDGEVTLVAHSFGGAIATAYAETFPDRVARIVNIEGFGPPPSMIATWNETPMWEQTARWVAQMRDLASRMPRRYATIDAAAERMKKENPSLSQDQARHLTVHGVARNEDGSYSWKFDNYFRAMPPREWRPEGTREQWKRVTCPMLLVRGSKSWALDPRKDGLIDVLRDGRYVELEGAGHYVHHDRLEGFVDALEEFLDATPASRVQGRDQARVQAK